MTNWVTINAEDVRKAFGTVVAPGGADLHADPDRVLALAGPSMVACPDKSVPGIGGSSVFPPAATQDHCCGVPAGCSRMPGTLWRSTGAISQLLRRSW